MNDLIGSKQVKKIKKTFMIYQTYHVKANDFSKTFYRIHLTQLSPPKMLFGEHIQNAYIANMHCSQSEAGLTLG